MSGIGFLGAGIILTRRAIEANDDRHLVWPAALACGGSPLRAALHFITSLRCAPLVQFILCRAHGHKVTLWRHYSPGHGVLSTLLTQVGALGWSVIALHARFSPPHVHTARFGVDCQTLTLDARDDARGSTALPASTSRKRTTVSTLRDTTGRGPRLLPRTVLTQSVTPEGCRGSGCSPMPTGSEPTAPASRAPAEPLLRLLSLRLRAVWPATRVSLLARCPGSGLRRVACSRYCWPWKPGCGVGLLSAGRAGSAAGARVQR